MTIVPTVASAIAERRIGRISPQPAVSPPSKRISTRPIVPSVWARPGVVEVDAADPLGAGEHPEAEEQQQPRDPNPVRDQGAANRDREQQPDD